MKQKTTTKKELFQSLCWISLFFIIYLSIFEFLSSTPLIYHFIKYPTPSMDSIFPELDVKLQRFFKEKEFNCIFLGSSMVDTGIEPRLIEESLNNRLDTNYRCFNFGFSSSMVEVSGSIVNTIQFKNSEKFDLIIWGISPIDMDPNFTKTRPIAKMPAFSYFNEKPSLSGWIYNYFSLPWFLGSLPHFQNDYYMEQLAYYDGLLDSRGMRRVAGLGELEEDNQSIFLPDYYLNTIDVDVLQKSIDDFKKNGTKVIFVEMPVHKSLYPRILNDGALGYQEVFLNPMKDFFRMNEVPFIETESQINDFVNDSHWTNNYHLNIFGAEIFTEYISDRILREGMLK